MVSDMHIAYIAMGRPISGRWFSTVPKNLLLGSPAAVSRYNILGPLFGDIITRILRIPKISFVGDFGSPLRPSISLAAMGAFRTVSELVGGF